MPTSVEITVAALGALLVLVGLVGGGFTYLGTTMPQVGRLARIGCFVVGGALILFSGSMSLVEVAMKSEPGQAQPPSTPPGPVPPTPSPDPDPPVTFAVEDVLTDGALAEQVAVELDGRPAGTLTADVEDDDVRLTVSDYTAGTLSYALDATVVFPTGDGGTVPVRVSGDGQVTVDQGTVLQVVVRGTAQDPHLTLESMT